MPESTIVKNMRDGTLTVDDGVNTYTVKYEGGNLQLNIPGPSVSHYLDRGKLADTLHGTPSLRFNEDQPMTGSFSAYLRDIVDDTYTTLPGMLVHDGDFADNWTSRGGANAEVKTVRLTWAVEGTNHGDASDHSTVLDHVWLTGQIAEGDPSMVTVNFTSYDLYPTVT